MTETAKGPILFFDQDLMRGIGVVNSARAQGFEIDRVTSLDQVIDRLAARDYVLVLLDMNKPLDWQRVATLVAQEKMPPVIGFGPHVDVEGRRAAKNAGLKRIYSNGDFHAEMVAILEKQAR